jgi:hypothetical protein
MQSWNRPNNGKRWLEGNITMFIRAIWMLER